MSKVRWGLLSTANINRELIPAIRASARGELVAVASRSRKRATEYAANWEIPQVFGSYEGMLRSNAVDAVYISLPNHLHAEWTLYALRHGKHVLCEKPLALTLAQVDEMTAAAAAAGRVLAEAFMYRHHPQTLLAKEWVENGRLGEVNLLRATFNTRIQAPDNVRLVLEWGGGCLWDVGVYPLSLAQYLYGEAPHWVFGSQWVGDTGVDEFFAGQMIYSNGRLAQLESSFRTPYYTAAEVVGTRGRLMLKRPFVGQSDPGCEMTFYPADGEPQILSVAGVPLYLGEVEDMNAAILDGTPCRVTLAESRDHIRTALALYESARTGQVVPL